MNNKVVEVWDKKSAINGVSASEVLKDTFLKNQRVLLLVKSKATDRVFEIQGLDILKDLYIETYEGTASMTDEEFIVFYQKIVDGELTQKGISVEEEQKQIQEQKNKEEEVEDYKNTAVLAGISDLYEQNIEILERITKLENSNK